MTEKRISKDNLKRSVKYIGNIMTVLSVIYIVINICQMEINVTELLDKKKLTLLGVLGIFITLYCLFILSYAWMQPLQWFGNKKIKFVEVVAIYLKSNIGKYLPGNVIHYVERNLFAANTGISQVYITISSIMEIILIIVTALGISVVFSYKELMQVFTDLVVPTWMITVIGVFIVLFLVLFVFLFHIPKVRNFLRKITREVISKQGIVVLVKMEISYIIMLCSNGICFALICVAISENAMDIKTIIYLMNCYILAWVVGYCMPGAPGGVGLRELVIILLAQNIMNSEIVVLAALIHRIITVLGDFFGYGISLGINVCLKEKKCNI